MQLSVIDAQIQWVKDSLAKYTYTPQEKEVKLSYLRGFVDGCFAAQVISVNEHKALLLEIHAL